MHVSIEKGELIIRLPLNKTPKPSSTGKSLVVASTGGNVTTAVQVDGKSVVVGVNAYIKA